MIDRRAYDACRQRVHQRGYRFSFRAGIASVWEEIFRGTFAEVEGFVRERPPSVPLTATTFAPQLAGCVAQQAFTLVAPATPAPPSVSAPA